MNRLHILFTLLFAATVKADCQLQPIINLDDIAEVAGAVEIRWHPDDSKARVAPCKQGAPTIAEMESYLRDRSTRINRSAVVNGVALEDETSLIQLFDKIHKKSIHHDKNKNYARGAGNLSVPAGCKSVKCAMQSLYGEKVGVQLLYMYSKFSFNGSHLSQERARHWRPEELDRIIAGLNDLPETFFPLYENQRFVHTGTTKESAVSGNTIADSAVNVYNNWNTETATSQVTTIAHELGHNISHRRNLEEKPEWLNLSGWKSKPNGDDPGSVQWTMTRPTAAVSEYGKTNPGEDFAETLAAYRYDGANLKRTHPDKYNYMKNVVFTGVEYDSEEHCSSQRTAMQASLDTLVGTIPQIPARMAKESSSIQSFHRVQTLQLMAGYCMWDAIRISAQNRKQMDDCLRVHLPRSYVHHHISQVLTEKSWVPGAYERMTDRDVQQVPLPPEEYITLQREARALSAKWLAAEIRKGDSYFSRGLVTASPETAAKECQEAVTLSGKDILLRLQGIVAVPANEPFWAAGNVRGFDVWLTKVCIAAKTTPLIFGMGQSSLEWAIDESM